MKKRFGYLTLWEVSEICMKHGDCAECPLRNMCGSYRIGDMISYFLLTNKCLKAKVEKSFQERRFGVDMERLTEKEVNACGTETGFYSVKNGESNTYIHDNLGNPRNLNKMFVAKQKLGQLEDLEDELGIDLITSFRALKNGVYCKDEYGGEEIEFHDVRGIEKNGLSVISNICKFAECDWTVYFKDYGKTWALTKEELE